jgi:transposase InsO family protein
VTHRRSQHPNAVLTPAMRRRMVDCVFERGWTIEATAERFQVDAKTVRKWRDRFLAEGDAGLQDRSSRPKRSPKRTPFTKRRLVLQLRRDHRWGAAHIGHEVGLAASTVQSILTRAGIGRLDRGDRATAKPQRYQWPTPGAMIHIDIKKIAAIPDGGGWRMHGRGNDGHGGHSGAGYRYIHTAIDDCTRLAYSETLNDEGKDTATAFLQRTVIWFRLRGVAIERVLTDNGSCYRSRAWRDTCTANGITHKRIRPYRPQTNGKVERFHRILLEEWAYIRNWTSENERVAGYDAFMHFYNHHRSHGALRWSTPMATLTRLRDDLPGQHS